MKRSILCPVTSFCNLFDISFQDKPNWKTNCGWNMLHYRIKFLVHFSFIYVIDLYFDIYLLKIGHEYVKYNYDIFIPNVFANVSFIIQRVQITSWWAIFDAFNFQLLTVAVFACFLILWTPHHVQRIIYIVITKLEISWTRDLIDIQETMHLIAGNLADLKLSCSRCFNSLVLNNC